MVLKKKKKEILDLRLKFIIIEGSSRNTKEETSFYKVTKTNWIAGYGSGIESHSHYRNTTLK